MGSTGAVDAMRCVDDEEEEEAESLESRRHRCACDAMLNNDNKTVKKSLKRGKFTAKRNIVIDTAFSLSDSERTRKSTSSISMASAP